MSIPLATVESDVFSVTYYAPIFHYTRALAQADVCCMEDPDPLYEVADDGNETTPPSIQGEANTIYICPDGSCWTLNIDDEWWPSSKSYLTKIHETVTGASAMAPANPSAGERWIVLWDADGCMIDLCLLVGSPPADPVWDYEYLISNTPDPSGPWAESAGMVARWDSPNWRTYPPRLDRIYRTDDGRLWRSIDGQWIETTGKEFYSYPAGGSLDESNSGAIAEWTGSAWQYDRPGREYVAAVANSTRVYQWNSYGGCFEPSVTKYFVTMWRGWFTKFLATHDAAGNLRGNINDTLVNGAFDYWTENRLASVILQNGGDSFTRQFPREISTAQDAGQLGQRARCRADTHIYEHNGTAWNRAPDAVPDIVTEYGLWPVKGDIIGHWLFAETQQSLNVCRWDSLQYYGTHSIGMMGPVGSLNWVSSAGDVLTTEYWRGYSINRPTLAEALANAQENWQSYQYARQTPYAGAYYTYEYDQDYGDQYDVEAERANPYLQIGYTDNNVGLCTWAGGGLDLYWYAFVEPMTAFDPQGDGVTEGWYRWLDEPGVAATGLHQAPQRWMANAVGSFPPNCPENTELVGYRVTNERVLIDWSQRLSNYWSSLTS